MVVLLSATIFTVIMTLVCYLFMAFVGFSWWPEESVRIDAAYMGLRLSLLFWFFIGCVVEVLNDE
jgi:hypothetical protein